MQSQTKKCLSRSIYFVSFLCSKMFSFSFFSLLTPQSIPALSDHPGMDTAVSGIDGHLKGHVKKPLNAFMLYMKDMRSKVVSECTLKESAAINQILGKRVMPNYRLLQDMVFLSVHIQKCIHLQLHALTLICRGYNRLLPRISAVLTDKLLQSFSSNLE